MSNLIVTRRGAKMPRLIVKRGQGKHQLLDLTHSITEVGRSEEMGLVLPNISVSRHHARFRSDGASIRVEDVGSQNGVRVNGEKLEPNTGKDLAVDDVVSIGKFEFFVIDPNERFYKGRFVDYMTPYSATAAPVQQEATYAMPAAEAEALEKSRALIRNARVMENNDSGKFWHPEDQPLTIGKNAMILVGGMLTPAIAAEIVWEQNQHVLKKKGMVGKVLVNGNSTKAHGMRDGDRFQVGDKEFIYRFK